MLRSRQVVANGLLKLRYCAEESDEAPRRLAHVHGPP